MAEKFDYDKVQRHLNDMDILFDEFATELRLCNDQIDNLVNNSSDRKLFGERAAKLKRVWEENSSTFGDFKMNFDDWSKMITLVGINNQKFENFITTTGNTLSQEAYEKSNYAKRERNVQTGNYATTEARHYADSNWKKKEEEALKEESTGNNMFAPSGSTNRVSDDGNWTTYEFTNADGNLVRKYVCDHDPNMIYYEVHNKNSDQITGLYLSDGTQKDGNFITGYKNQGAALAPVKIDANYFTAANGNKIREQLITDGKSDAQLYSYVNSQGCQIQEWTNGQKTVLYCDITNGKYYDQYFNEITEAQYRAAVSAI